MGFDSLELGVGIKRLGWTSLSYEGLYDRSCHDAWQVDVEPETET
jgi:hypothetical protein